IVVSAGTLPDGYIGERADGKTGTFRVMDGKRVVVTGDFARAERDGTLTLIGRGSSVINSGGEKIFADEVEQVIAQHPGVADVIVAGVPDPRWGHLVGAVVALRPDHRAQGHGQGRPAMGGGAAGAAEIKKKGRGEPRPFSHA